MAQPSEQFARVVEVEFCACLEHRGAVETVPQDACNRHLRCMRGAYVRQGITDHKSAIGRDLDQLDAGIAAALGLGR